jgi:hypothetical protein
MAGSLLPSCWIKALVEGTRIDVSEGGGVGGKELGIHAEDDDPN